MSERQADAALAGSVFTALFALAFLGIGVALVFNGGWALIMDGAVLVIYSLVIALSRRSQTLLYADTTTNARN